jgi:hypothetical protein
MTRNMVRGGALMATLLALAGCNRPSPFAEQQGTAAPGLAPDVARPAGTGGPITVPVPTVVFSANSFTEVPVTTCSGKAGAAVVWTLEDVFSGLSNNRRVKRIIVREINGVDTKVDEIPADEVGNNWPTNLDMDTTSAGSDYVMVTIVLKIGASGNKPGVHFLRPRSGALPTGPDPGGTNSSVAVLTPPLQSPGGSSYCGRTPIDTSVAGTERFSFGVRNAADARSLNIGLLVPTKKEKITEPQMWLPIFLDPNIRNTG